MSRVASPSPHSSRSPSPQKVKMVFTNKISPYRKATSKLPTIILIISNILIFSIYLVQKQIKTYCTDPNQYICTKCPKNAKCTYNSFECEGNSTKILQKCFTQDELDMHPDFIEFHDYIKNLILENDVWTVQNILDLDKNLTEEAVIMAIEADNHFYLSPHTNIIYPVLWIPSITGYTMILSILVSALIILLSYVMFQ